MPARVSSVLIKESGTMLISDLPVDVRLKAIKTAIAMTSGAYKTSLVSYFTHRDLFPSLMKVWLTASLLISC